MAQVGPRNTPASLRRINLLVIVAMLIGTTSLGQAPAQAARPPLDLAAMALTPSDLESAGLDDHGITWSMLTDRPRQAEEFINDFEYDALFDDGAVIRQADADRTYIALLSDDELTPTGAMFWSVVSPIVLEYDDDDAARDALEAIVDTWADLDQLRETPGDFQAGRGYAAFMGAGAITGPSDPFFRWNVAFRTGNIVSVILVLSYDGREERQAAIEELATRQEANVEDVLDHGAPDLSGLMVRMRIPGGNFYMDAYLTRNGESIRRSNEYESEEMFAERQDDIDEREIIDTYVSNQAVRGSIDPANDPGPITRVLFRVDTFERASAVEPPDDLVERLTEGGWMQQDDALDFGDHTMALILSPIEEDLNGLYRVMVWVDNMLVTVEYRTEVDAADPGWTPSRADTDAVNDLVALQVDCLEGTASCDRAIPVPAAFDPSS